MPAEKPSPLLPDGVSHAMDDPDPPDASAALVWPDARWKQQFRRRLRGWFRKFARDLPWRRTRELYRIWVSEIMLQQTQVATVIPYYEAFLEAFPSLPILASADQREVLRRWEGLGYYRRARQLHEAARQMVAQHDGQFPEDAAQLQQLPGIGRYTAGAILSIGRDQRLPILEANTIRLFSRLLAYPDDPRGATGQRILWEFAERILPRRETGQFNQALMELGSEICTPKQPRCEACPVSALCPTRQRGWQSRIPVATKRVIYEDLREFAVVVRRAGKILIRQCQATERWAGLWDFPRFPVQVDSSVPWETQLAEGTRRLTGIRVKPGTHLARIKHGVTRYRITLDCFEAHYQGTDPPSSRQGVGPLVWVKPLQLKDYPLSVSGRKLARLSSCGL
jgi:A/G-specific adenine glycosylase